MGTDDRLKTIEARLQRLEDVEAIKEIWIRYSQASDNAHNLDVMLPLFAKDAIFDIGSGYGTYRGHDEIGKFLGGPANKIIPWSLHYMVSPLIEVAEDGKTARGFWYLWEIAKMVDPVTGQEEAVWIGGTYNNEFIKENGEWKLQIVRLKMELMSPYSEGWVKKPWHDFGRPQTKSSQSGTQS